MATEPRPGDAVEPPPSPAADPDPAPDPRIRRRLDEVFGEVLPDPTRDERDLGEPAAPAGDDALLAERPPHHDRA